MECVSAFAGGALAVFPEEPAPRSWITTQEVPQTQHGSFQKLGVPFCGWLCDKKPNSHIYLEGQRLLAGLVMLLGLKHFVHLGS